MSPKIKTALSFIDLITHNHTSHFKVKLVCVTVLLLPADPLLLVGGARPPGASLLLAGRQVFLLTHGAAAPRLTAVARRHWGAVRTTQVTFPLYIHFLSHWLLSDVSICTHVGWLSVGVWPRGWRAGWCSRSPSSCPHWGTPGLWSYAQSLQAREENECFLRSYISRFTYNTSHQPQCTLLHINSINFILFFWQYCF